VASIPHFPARLGRLPRLLRAVVLALSGLGGGWLGAQETVLAAGSVTTVGEFWNVPPADRQKEHPLRMDLIVYYYDPSWRLLYGETGGTASYLPVRGPALPIKSGQKVRLEGTVVPADGIDGERIKTTLLAERQLPEPLPIAGRMEDLASLNGRWVVVEGHVLSQVEPDPTHIEAQLWSEGRLISLFVQVDSSEPVPQLTGARVRLHGVYDVGVDSRGGVQHIQVWTAETQRLEVTGWLADDPRFKLPRTPIDQLGAAVGRPWVRIVGEVQSVATGAGLTVRDDTGQTEIATQQPGVPPVGTAVEVVGRPAAAELGWTLQEPLFRRADAASLPVRPREGPGRVPMRLRLAEQILQLTPEEAARPHPVTLRGIVTWSDRRSGQFYLQDVSGGITVTRSGEPAPDFGTAMSLTGVTMRGAQVPAVEALAFEQYGTQPLPPPRRISLEQAMAGAEEGRWVEMRGYVRQVTPGRDWLRLDLVAPTGEFEVMLPPGESSDQLQGAMVRVQGVCVGQPGVNREQARIQVWAQDRGAITVEEAAPADPFAVAPLEPVTALPQLSAAQAAGRRLRLQGTVLLHEPGRYLHVQDESGGVFVLSRGTERLTPGTRVELVGLPGWLGSRPVLREARWRPASPAGTPEPLELENVALPVPAADSRLVRVRAVLRQAVTEAGQAHLTLQAGATIFDCTLREAAGWTPPGVGSRLALTGVYVLEYDEYRRPHGFRLELRVPADIAVLEAPSWWTVERIWTVVGVLGLVISLGFTWIAVLRRRVRRQTELIRVQLEKEARLQTELERSSRLESLGVLAGGIAHDFNNLLTAILGNLGLASMDKRVMEAAGDCIGEAERGARRARDITQQLLTFAKGGDPVRTAVQLPEIVTEAANFARHGSNVRFDFDLPSNLPPGDVDAGQISRVVHNLVINAVQAMPDGGVVSIALAAVDLAAGQVDLLPAGSYLRLTIADTGRGIPAEALSRIFDPYFSTKGKTGNSGLGLATVRSIIKKHNGHIEVESVVGRGTTFRLWLPAAPHELPVLGATPPRSAAHLPARILVMDDEEVIRRVAGRMLALAGHEAVFAADGADAVRAYSAARQSGRPFDLVIFDLTVPGGMGGKDALQELLKLDPDIRAIASSGYSSDPVMANPRTYGFCTSLPKPYDIPDLMRAVEAARRQ
jgi:two-component system, cell cycle sensor histidine kinase and response regulator CckA